MTHETYTRIESLLLHIEESFGTPRSYEELVRHCRRIQFDAKTIQKSSDWQESMGQNKLVADLAKGAGYENATRYVIGIKGLKSASKRVSRKKDAR